MKIKIKPDGGPVYRQIEEQLASAIEKGSLRPGEKLPPERDMAVQLGISRMTVRQAFDGLARRALVDRGVGRGTFVAAPKVELDHSRVVGFSEQMERAGLEPAAEVLSSERVAAPAEVAAELGIEAGAGTLHVRRLRSGGGVPMTIEDFWLPLELFPGIEDADLSGSLYSLLRERYASGPVRAVERLEPVHATAPQARLLEIPARSPVMLVERVAYDAEGRAVEFARDRHRGDRARFVIEVAL